jgi:hypothetical protein
MSWEYVEYHSPFSQFSHKELVWVSAPCRVYFAFKLLDDDPWTYFAGKATHYLDTGQLLVSYGLVEGDAQTNYLVLVAGKNICILPSATQYKYARIYIQSGMAAHIYEWKTSERFSADEIVYGELLISDQFSNSPVIKILASNQERLLLGKLETGLYGIRGKSALGKVMFELRTDIDQPFVDGYADHRAIELELMKMNFQSISWAQFAIYDAFDNEDKRANPDTFLPNLAVVERSSLTNGGDETASRLFGFQSKSYANITHIVSGTGVGTLNCLTDSSKNWFVDECKMLTLVDSADVEFQITGNDSTNLVVSGTPASGSYVLKTANPQFMVAFCSFEDSTVGGGHGFVIMEISFDGGANWQTVLDTENAINLLEGTLEISNPGSAYSVRFTLKNDAGGGPVIYKFLVCTDPSVWRY